MKYLNAAVTMKEIPDEISLAINFIGCPMHCEKCHSPELWDTADTQGIEFTLEELKKLISENNKVSCILFMGGDWDFYFIADMIIYTKTVYKKKTALYSGNNLEYFKQKHSLLLNYLDYLKVGKYNYHYGGLDSKHTNQRLYKVVSVLENITYKFWEN